MLAVANRLKCEVHFATSALTKPSFQPLKILYIQQEEISIAFLGIWQVPKQARLPKIREDSGKPCGLFEALNPLSSYHHKAQSSMPLAKKVYSSGVAAEALREVLALVVDFTLALVVTAMSVVLALAVDLGLAVAAALVLEAAVPALVAVVPVLALVALVVLALGLGCS